MGLSLMNTLMVSSNLYLIKTDSRYNNNLIKIILLSSFPSTKRILARLPLTMLHLQVFHLFTKLFLLWGDRFSCLLFLKLLRFNKSQPGWLPHHYLLIFKEVLSIDSIFVDARHVDHDRADIEL